MTTLSLLCSCVKLFQGNSYNVSEGSKPPPRLFLLDYLSQSQNPPLAIPSHLPADVRDFLTSQPTTLLRLRPPSFDERKSSWLRSEFKGQRPRIPAKIDNERAIGDSRKSLSTWIWRPNRFLLGGGYVLFVLAKSLYEGAPRAERFHVLLLSSAAIRDPRRKGNIETFFTVHEREAPG